MATRRIKPRTPEPKRGQSSEDYWREREARQRAENIRNEAKTAEKINRIFATVQDDIQQEIDSFYHRYAKDEGIDLIEARRRVSQLDIKKYERLAAQYVKAAHEGAADVAFSEEANEQMRLYNTTMRINRLEMLKARCGIRAMSGYSEAQQLINDELEERAYSEYERLSGILGNTVQFNENLVRSIVNASYQNATWSERLWNNQSLLSEQIGAQLAQGILTGKGSRVLAANIRKLTGQSAYNCLRLMRTELRRVQTAAAEQSMRDNGVRQYKFMVENAINPCEECQNLDGHVYDLDEMAPGRTAPPIHPNCHCATAPYVDEDKWQRWLDGPAQNGVPWDEFENMPEAPAAPAFTPAETTAEANDFGTKMLGDAYENHRNEDGTRSVPLEELLELGSDIIKANYGKMSVESANAFNRALSDLIRRFDSPLQKIRTMTKEEFMANRNAFAFVRHDYTTDSAQLVINPTKCKDLSALAERIATLSERGYCVEIDPAKADQYVATHEFAHSMLNLEQKLNNKTNWVGANYDKVRAARKEIEGIFGRYVERVGELTKKSKDLEYRILTANTVEEAEALEKDYFAADAELNRIKLSEYSLANSDEFMAESFTNEQIGVRSKEYSAEVMGVLDKYFGRSGHD